MKNYTFVIFSRTTRFGKKRYYWKLMSGNNKVMARGGEPFNSIQAVRTSIRAIMTHADMADMKVLR